MWSKIGAGRKATAWLGAVGTMVTRPVEPWDVSNGKAEGGGVEVGGEAGLVADMEGCWNLNTLLGLGERGA